MKEKKLSLRQSMLYNSVGTMTYLGCQWLITVLAVRLGSFEDSGILLLATTLTGFFFTLCTFGIRVFQTSDTGGQYTAGRYISTRVLTGCIGLTVCIGYLLVHRGYSLYTTAAIFLYMIFRLSEALVDTLAAEEQKLWRMDRVGLSLILRGLLSIASFAVMMRLTRSMPLAFAVMALSALCVVYLFDYRFLKKHLHFSLHISLKESLPLMKEALPLMLNSALLMLLAAIPRSTLEASHGATMLGYYAAIATPAVIVQTGCSFIYTPLVTPLAELYRQGQKKAYRLTLLKALLGVLGMMAVILLAAQLLGEWGFRLIFADRTDALMPYLHLLLPVLMSTFCHAMIFFFDVPLTIMRKLKMMTALHAAAVVLMLITSSWLIPRYGIEAVNWVNYLCAGGDALCMGLIALRGAGR